MNRKVKLCFVVGGVSVALQFAAYAQSASVAAGQDAKADTVDVKIDNFSFTPATVTIRAGTIVKWTNRDDIPYTVVNDDQKFESKALDTDESYSYTFTKPGTYPYFCSIHQDDRQSRRAMSVAMLNPFDPRTVLLAKHAQHAVLVHFPIALFFTAAGFDFAAQRQWQLEGPRLKGILLQHLVRRRNRCWRLSRATT